VSATLPWLVDAFARLNVLVIGESMLDSYLRGSTNRLCPEAPVPIVDITDRIDQPGGAANSAINAHSLGANVRFFSVIGDDAEGHTLLRRLAERGVSSAHIQTERGRRTLSKQRIVAGPQLLLRFDHGSTQAIGPDPERRLLNDLAANWAACDAILVSDYGYGVLTDPVIAMLRSLQSHAPRVLVVDSKRLSLFRDVGATAVKPNYGEALRLLGTSEPPAPGDRVAWMESQGERILRATGARIASVTLDTEGALVFEHNRPPYRTYAKAEHPARAAGAGDTFASALALALAAGAETPAAADLASMAAAIVVAQDGTSACSPDELRARVAQSGKPLDGRDELAARVAEYRGRGRRIVFTNGCFDILHRGHISYLSRAKSLGDVLIVGVNSDSSIRRLKGPTRPINGLDDRLQVLSALSCVDHVVAFDEDLPNELIRAIRPDVFVKGGDYTRETLPEAALVERLGGTVEILPFLADRSTTDIIARIRQANAAALARDGTSAILGVAGGHWSNQGQLVGGHDGA
jgi:D-beta-D-heptose 7-phosphate kinase/D-beta-D-heptose 1-phosphate adenosyltransferase